MNDQEQSQHILNIRLWITINYDTRYLAQSGALVFLLRSKKKK